MKIHLLFIAIIAFSACNEVDSHKSKPIIAEESNTKDLPESTECPPSLVYNVVKLDGFRLYVFKIDTKEF